MNTAIYARTSTDRQEREDTVRSQLAACDAFAAAHQFLPAETFVDDGVSGATLMRPALGRLRDAIRSKLIARLIVYDTDRLSRSLSHLLILMEELNRVGAEIHFVKCPLEDTPEGRVLFNIKGVFGEYEREKIRERTLRGKVAFIKEGGWCGPPPFGYRIVAKRLQIHAVEAGWVREMFRLYAAGEATLHGLVRYLTQHEVPTRRTSRKGRGWQPEVIRTILGRELYTGIFRREIRGVPGSNCETAVPPIVDATIWQEVQKRFVQNKIESDRNKVNFYLLTGLIRCGVCGHGYYGRTKTSGVRYYRCETNHNRARFREVCTNKLVRASALETAVWNQVVDLITRPEAVIIGERFLADAAQTDGKAPLDEQLFFVRRRVTKLEAKKSRALDLILERPQDKLILSSKLNDLDGELNQLVRREQALIEAVGQVTSREQRLLAVKQAFRTLRPRLDALSQDDRRKVCQLLLEHLEINRQGEVTVNWLIPVGEGTGPEPNEPFDSSTKSEPLGAVVTEDFPE
jgi:site-specific DNA recombinase